MDDMLHWQLDDGELWLAIDSRRDGLTCGGLRLDPHGTAEDAAELARLMSLKLAVCHVPIGGAKALLAPRAGADRAAVLAQAGRALVDELRGGYLLGEDLGTTASDVVTLYEAAGVDPVALVRDRLRARGRDVVPDGLALGDLMNDDFAGQLAGAGAVVVLGAAARAAGVDLAGRTVAVQGFGTVGSAAAVQLAEAGTSVRTIADAERTVHVPDALDVDELLRMRGAEGRIDVDAVPARAEVHPSDAWTDWPVDVVVPAATARSVDVDVAHRLGATRFVLEAANGPLTDGAERVLEASGVVVLPDIVVNAGSAVAFGLLATGEATVEDVGERYVERIVQAVERAWARGNGSRLREHALHEAAEVLAGAAS